MGNDPVNESEYACSYVSSSLIGEIESRKIYFYQIRRADLYNTTVASIVWRMFSNGLSVAKIITQPVLGIFDISWYIGDGGAIEERICIRYQTTLFHTLAEYVSELKVGIPREAAEKYESWIT